MAVEPTGTAKGEARNCAIGSETIVDEEGSGRAGDLLQRDQVARQAVQPGGNDAERPPEIEPHERVQVEVERLGVDITEPDREPGACHGGRNGEARVRRDDHLSAVRALSHRLEEDRQGGPA